MSFHEIGLTPMAIALLMCAEYTPVKPNDMFRDEIEFKMLKELGYLDERVTTPKGSALVKWIVENVREPIQTWKVPE